MTTARVSELYYEELGDEFARLMSPYDVARRRVLIENLLPRDRELGDCLEVGCGTGEISRFLIGRVGHLTVCDISEKLSRNVGAELGCSWVQGNACLLPFPPSTFDLVVSSECIEHTPDPIAALGEMGRVLRAGGALVVTTPNKLWYPVLAIAMRLGLRKFQGNEAWLFPSTIKSWLRSQGFTPIRSSGCHLLPWQLPGIQHVLPLMDRAGPWLHPLMVNFGFFALKRSKPSIAGNR